MSTTTVGLFLRHLALSEEVNRLGTASDRNLLAAYESERGQAAFTELMRRHGPMVLRTCRRVLGPGPDADDAFQATFILLARKAGQLRRETAGQLSLGGWLHRVAYQTALDVLAKMTRRRTRERQVDTVKPSDPDPVAQATWNEVRPILDAELEALPDEARRLLIACYLQGKTHAEAAVELGLPLGSLAWRLEKARALLAKRLVRQGITLSTASLAVLLAETANGAGMPAVLLVHSVEAAVRFTAQVDGVVSANVARLVKSGLANLAKGSTGFSLACYLGLAVMGAGLLACWAPGAGLEQIPESTPPAAQAAKRLKQDNDKSFPTDRFGDPLPHDALARLGTVRLRQVTGVHALDFTPDGQGLITAGRGEPARLWDRTTGRLRRSFGDSRENRVYTAALSPDGRTLAGRVAAGDLCLWDVATGTLLRRLKAGPLGAEVNLPLVFSPDGKMVAAVDSGMLRLWQTAAGQELWAVNLGGGNQQGVAALAFSADGKTLLWADHPKGCLHLWEAATGKEVRCWDGEKAQSIWALARAPDGRLLTVHRPSVEAPGLARLWDMATGKEALRLAGEDAENILTAAFSPDGKVLATGCLRGPLCLWDAATGKELHRCASSLNTRSLAFSPDGKTLASGGGGDPLSSGNQAVRFWDVQTGREVSRADDGHQATVCSVAFTPDGKDIVSGSWDGSLCVWDGATGEQRRRLAPADNEHFVGGTMVSIASAISADGKTLVSARWERIEPKSYFKVRSWERETGRELRGWSLELERWASPLALSPDGKTVACMTDAVHLREAATGKELARIAKGYPVFSADGKLLATAPLDGKDDGPGSFTVWESATAKELCSGLLPEGRVHRLLFSSDGRMLATASTTSRRNGDRSSLSAIHLWPLLRDESRTSGVRVGPPRLLAAGIESAWSPGILRSWFGVWAFSPDSRTLAIAGADGTVRLLETATGKERTRFAGHEGDVAALSFSPDGRRLASGSRDTTILVWDVTGRLQDGRLRPARLTAREREELWADLAADDAARAGRALWTLAADPAGAAPLLAEHLRTAALDATTARARIPRLLRDLDDDAFSVRQKAQAELAGLGEAAEPALRQASTKSPSAEAHRRLEQLLRELEAKRGAPVGVSLRGLRAVEALEQIGTAEARQTLKTLTAGTAAESVLAEAARAALDRLERIERR